MTNTNSNLRRTQFKARKITISVPVPENNLVGNNNTDGYESGASVDLGKEMDNTMNNTIGKFEV